jgi:hypothetical protein
MLRALRSDAMKTLPSALTNAPYSPSGSRKQLVWPYMVSGRSVAAVKNTGVPADSAATSGASAPAACGCSGGTACRRILMSVYSCGLTPSPDARSWSAHAWPSMGEKTVGRLPKPSRSRALSSRNCHRMKAS